MACPATHCASAAATATVEAKVFILKVESQNRSKVEEGETSSSSLFNTAERPRSTSPPSAHHPLYLPPTPHPHHHPTRASHPEPPSTPIPILPKEPHHPVATTSHRPHEPPQYQHPIIPPAIPPRYQNCHRQRDAHPPLQLAESRRGTPPRSTTTANSALHRTCLPP